MCGEFDGILPKGPYLPCVSMAGRALLAGYRQIHRSLVNSPQKDQWRGALMFSLICAWMNGWVNNHEAGDLRCHHSHYYCNVALSHRYVHTYGLSLDKVVLRRHCKLSYLQDSKVHPACVTLQQKTNCTKIVIWHHSFDFYRGYAEFPFYSMSPCKFDFYLEQAKFSTLTVT